MKKLLAVLSAATLMTTLAACGAAGTAGVSSAASEPASAGEAAYRVAIVQQMDHASLDEIRTAIEA